MANASKVASNALLSNTVLPLFNGGKISFMDDKKEIYLNDRKKNLPQKEFKMLSQHACYWVFLSN